jgi:nucleotide-binding universal stress UspA family protein
VLPAHRVYLADNRKEEHVSASGTGPILLSYDNSDGARRAIEVAATLFPGRAAVVLHVWSPISVVTAAYGGLMALPDYEESTLEQSARDVAQSGADLARAAGLDARPEIVEGTYEGTWHAIVEAGAQQGAALIVLGARGLSTFQSFVLGSVSHGVAQHSRVPVLIVPPAPS